MCEQRVDLAWRWAAEGKNDDDSSVSQTVVDHMFPGVLLKCRLRFRGPGAGGGLRVCFSDKLPGEADVVGTWVDALSSEV